MIRYQLLGKGYSGATQEYKLHISSGFIRFDLRDASAGATVSAYTASAHAGLAGAWHHLAVTYDGRGGATAAYGVTIYIDGTAVPLTRISNVAYVAMENLSAPVQIGRESPSWQQFDGALDEIRIWNGVRSAAAIQAFHTAEVTGSEPGLVAYWRFNEGAGASVVDDSPNEYTALLYNNPAWLAGGPLAPPIVDTAAPEITAVTTTQLTPTSVTIGFNTNEPTTGWVAYAPGACPCADVYSATVGTAHGIGLTGLTPNTTYSVVVRARDAANNMQETAPFSVTTPPLPIDVEPPNVAFTSPAAEDVSGVVLVQATATDVVGVASVQFKLDGLNLGAADSSAPYSLSWDTRSLANGPYTLTAEARDAANNVTTASVTVTVSNVPMSTTPHYLEFDGVNDYVDVADTDALSFGNGAADTPLSIEMWFRPDVMSRHQLLGKGFSGATLEYKLHLASGFIRFDLRDASAGGTVSAYTASSQAALVGAWHHLAVTYDGRGGANAADGITLYIDGTAVPLTRVVNAAYVAMENLAAPIQIGREGPGWRQYDGALDDIRIWNVVRSATEIQAFMTAELDGSEPGLVSNWKLNEAAGTSAADSGPANNEANAIDGPTFVAGPPLP
jgi:hypothetical protein